MKKINLSLCFKEAWKGFKSWWIPLCIVASIIVLTQVTIPKKIVANELKTLKPYSTAYHKFKNGVSNNPTQFFNLYLNFIMKCSELNSDPAMQHAFAIMLFKLISIVGIIICFLNVIMIILAKASVEQDEQRRTIKRDFSRSFILSFAYIFLAFVKIIPFLFCILPGIYIYCRLYFTGFIITEESANPIYAIKKSWEITKNNFLEILILFLITIFVNLISIISIIGLIPGSSFNYTLRAAAYKQIKNK